MMILRWSELNNNLNMSTPNVKDSEDKGGNESNQPLMAHETSGEAVFRRASADGHLFNPHENGHLPNSSLGPFAMMIGKNINKICHLLMTLLCILAFLSLTFVSLTQLLSKDVGTIVRVETGPEHPDMTLCSFGYNTRNYSELITQLPHPDYTLNDTSLSKIKNLPSITDMVKSIWVYHHQHDSKGSYIVWHNGFLNPDTTKMSVSEFIQESFVIWPGNYWHKCVTLKFPKVWKLGTQSHLAMLFNFTLIDKLMIQYHSRGQAKILASSNNVYIANFPSYGSVYDLKMKKKTYLRNCTDDKEQAEYNCTMNFIASKMNCSIALSEKMFYPKHFPLCKTKYDLDLYIELRKNIYRGFYKEELKKCFVKTCTEASWVASYQAPITKEHNQEIKKVFGYNEKEKLSALSFWMPYSEVEVAEEYVIYNLPDFIGDFGGYLGLFLGWSVQSILLGFIFKLKEIFVKFRWLW